MKLIWVNIFCSIVLSCSNAVDNLKQSLISPMPEFNIQLCDSSTIFNMRKVPVGKPAVIIYFDPGCDHCEQQTKEIVEKSTLLNNINIYFISLASFQQLADFRKRYHFERFKNIVVAKDVEFSFIKLFKGNQVPLVAIYNSFRQLKIVYTGVTTAEEILTALNVK